MTGDVVNISERTPRRIPYGKMTLAEFKRHEWFAQVEASITLDDILEHDFWLQKPGKVLPFDEIIVHPEDGRWRAHLHVIESDDTGLLVDIISYVEFKRVEEMRAAEGLAYRIRNAGPGSGFKIVRSDGVETRGFATRQAAQDYLRDHSASIRPGA